MNRIAYTMRGHIPTTLPFKETIMIITLHRVVHKSTVEVVSHEMDIKISAITAFHDGMIVVGSHQFNVAESRYEINQKITEAGAVWE